MSLLSTRKVNTNNLVKISQEFDGVGCVAETQDISVNNRCLGFIYDI